MLSLEDFPIQNSPENPAIHISLYPKHVPLFVYKYQSLDKDESEWMLKKQTKRIPKIIKLMLKKHYPNKVNSYDHKALHSHRYASFKTSWSQFSQGLSIIIYPKPILRGENQGFVLSARTSAIAQNTANWRSEERTSNTRATNPQADQTHKRPGQRERLSWWNSSSTPSGWRQAGRAEDKRIHGELWWVERRPGVPVLTLNKLL